MAAYVLTVLIDPTLDSGIKYDYVHVREVMIVVFIIALKLKLPDQLPEMKSHRCS